jgi:hypothetical protein
MKRLATVPGAGDEEGDADHAVKPWVSSHRTRLAQRPDSELGLETRAGIVL